MAKGEYGLGGLYVDRRTGNGYGRWRSPAGLKRNRVVRDAEGRRLAGQGAGKDARKALQAMMGSAARSRAGATPSWPARGR